MEKSLARNRTCICIAFDPDFYYLIQSYAERSGMNAVLVSCTGDLLERMKDDPPAVICLEPEQLLDETAWDVLAEIKADREMAKIPVILFSWLDEADRAVEAGADVYVKKPVMYIDFIDALSVAGLHNENPSMT